MLGTMVVLGACRTPSFTETSELINHDLWDTLLQQHVHENGLVNYKGFQKDQAKLDQYLDMLSDNPPNGPQWTQEHQLAYWINAYNAFTVKLILDHYPVSSIKDIKKGISFVNSVWDIEFFTIGNQRMDLTTIEHGILRKEFDEPRIHFAINCASMSCPKLHNRAYVADQINQQLEYAAKVFINDERRNKIHSDQIKISKIFSWFKGDFTKSSNLITFLNQYSQTTIEPNASLDFLDYDWSLNEVQE